MENRKQVAFPAHSKTGLTKEEYAVIHLTASPPAEFINQYIEKNPGPSHPGLVFQVFRGKETKEGKSYANAYLQHYFDSEKGKWKSDSKDVVPQEVIDDVNVHVEIVNKYYEDLEAFKLDRYIQMEIIWRRKVGVALMDSFDK